jgi:cysteine synthase A
MAKEPCPIPTWIVCGAGTGGTSATIGRFVRYHRHATSQCVADPDQSVFHKHWQDRAVTSAEGCGTLIEGIGRPRVEPSFLPDVVDRMIAVTDAQSIAAAAMVSRKIGRACGGSTGTNVWACARLATEMAERGESGAIVTILCDDGARYRDTIFDQGWLDERGIDTRAEAAAIAGFLETGRLAF